MSALKFLGAALVAGSMLLGAQASEAANKLPITVTLTGPSVASVSHDYSATVKVSKALKGVVCTGKLDGNDKTPAFSLNSSGTGKLVVPASFFKKKFAAGKKLAAVTVNCQNSKYIGTSLPIALVFTH